MAMTISYLISCLATIGRTGAYEIFTSLLVYNIIWPFAFFWNMKIYYQEATPALRIFDDFGLTHIYTFAAFFGIVYSFILNRKPSENVDRACPSRFSSIMSIFGSTLVFCTVPTTIYLFPIHPATDNGRYNVGILNVYFAQAAAILVSISISLLLGKQRIGIHQVIVSTLSGAITVAAFATIETNIGIFLLLGGLGGALTAIWMTLFHLKINKNSIIDSLGLIGAVLLPSFMAAIIITPIFYRVYVDK